MARGGPYLHHLLNPAPARARAEGATLLNPPSARLQRWAATAQDASLPPATPAPQRPQPQAAAPRSVIPPARTVTPAPAPPVQSRDVAGPIPPVRSGLVPPLREAQQAAPMPATPQVTTLTSAPQSAARMSRAPVSPPPQTFSSQAARNTTETVPAARDSFQTATPTPPAPHTPDQPAQPAAAHPTVAKPALPHRHDSAPAASRPKAASPQGESPSPRPNPASLQPALPVPPRLEPARLEPIAPPPRPVRAEAKLEIGSIEVRVLPPAPPAPPPQPPHTVILQQQAPRTPLARGFLSGFGLKEG